MAEWKFIGARRYECSACGEGIPDMPCDWNNGGEPLYNFCPYCGANMNMKKADGRYEPRGDEIIVRSNLYPFRVVEADRKTEPLKIELTAEDLQDWKDRMWAEAIATEPQTSCKTCRFGEVDEGYVRCAYYSKATEQTEPQTERSR